jgi:methylated-DNA-protein-cysteine methyltransferase-like protein
MSSGAGKRRSVENAMGVTLDGVCGGFPSAESIHNVSGLSAPISRYARIVDQPSNRERIYAVVSLIPAGTVATYGQIAELAGLPRQARQVGYALAALDAERDIPWHRVINAKGGISVRSFPGAGLRQRALLESEGIRFDVHGRVSLQKFGWRP